MQSEINADDFFDSIEEEKEAQASPPLVEQPAAKPDVSADEFFGYIEAEEREASKAVLSKDPGLASREREAAKQMETSRTDASANLEEYESVAKRNEMQEKLKDAPVFTGFLANNQADAPILQNDVDFLIDIEKRLAKFGVTESEEGDLELDATAITGWQAAREDVTENAVKGFESGYAMGEEGIAYAGVRDNKIKVDEAFKSRSAENEKKMKAMEGNESFVAEAAQIVGTMVAAFRNSANETAAASGAVVGAAMATGFAAPAAATVAGAMMMGGSLRAMYDMEGGLAYKDMIEKGARPDEAKLISQGVGLVNSLIEFGGVTLMGKAFAPVLRVLVAKNTAKVAAALSEPSMTALLKESSKAMAKSIGAEVTTEVMQELVNVAGEGLAKEFADAQFDDITLESLWDRLSEIAIKTAKGMVVLGALSMGPTVAMGARKVMQAREAEAFFTALNDGMTKSEAKQIAPDVLAGVVQQMSEEARTGVVYVDAAEFQQAMIEHGITAEQIDEIVPGMSQTLAQKALNKQDLVFPTGQYAAKVAGTDLGKTLVQHVRLDQDALSVADAVKLHKEQAKMLKGVMDGTVKQEDIDKSIAGMKDDEYKAEYDKLKDRMFEELKATGAYANDQEAKGNAKFGAWLVTNAVRRSGLPVDMVAKLAPRIIGAAASANGNDLVQVGEADETLHQLRTKPAPKKTVKAYKLFRVKKSAPGKLFPLFVDANTPVPIGVWEDATEGPKSAKNDKKVKSRIGDLHYRPGWHAGDLPLATHIGGRSHKNPKLPPDIREEDQVWAEVEFAADIDYQPEATANGYNEKGKFVAANAEIDRLPVDGFYRYKTNPNMTGEWLIGGSMKINRILSDEEVEAINAEAGLADLKRAKPFDRKLYGFDEYGYPVEQPAKAVKQEQVLEQKAKVKVYSQSEWRVLKRTLDSMTEEERVLFNEYLDSRADGERIRANLERLKDTPWAKQAIEAVFVRIAMRDLMSGNEPRVMSMLDNDQAAKARADLKDGAEGLWRYLTRNSFVGNASKPAHNVNSSFINCDPSNDCAKFCYATKGNYTYSGTVIKSELISEAIAMDPLKAAKLTADQYKATAEFHMKKALRLFDKGDGDETWLPYIEELNKQGVRVQIFSKRPAFLRQVSDYNVRLLSIDESNKALADANPDLGIAYVYSDESQIPDLLELHKQGRIQVILPVKIGRSLLPEAKVKALISQDKTIGKHVCWIDAGKKTIKTKKNPYGWNCTMCDKNAGVGCFVGQSTEEVMKAAAKADAMAIKMEDMDADQVVITLQTIKKDLDNAIESMGQGERASDGVGGEQGSVRGSDGNARLNDVSRQLDQLIRSLLRSNDSGAKRVGGERTDDASDALPGSNEGVSIERVDDAGGEREDGPRSVYEIAHGGAKPDDAAAQQLEGGARGVRSEAEGNGIDAGDADREESLGHRAWNKVVELAQKAWHGSPHTFNKFLLSAIGSGEGAQVHGWGLYFTASKQIAEMYRSVLLKKQGDPIYKYKGEVVDVMNDPRVAGLLEVLRNVPKGDVPAFGKLSRSFIDSAIREYASQLERARKMIIEKQFVVDLLSNEELSADQIQEALLANGYVLTARVVRESSSSPRTKTRWRSMLLDQEYGADLSYWKNAEESITGMIDRAQSLDIENVTIENSMGTGRVFEVEIPDSDVMLDEQLPFEKQPEAVKKGLKEIFNRIEGRGEKDPLVAAQTAMRNEGSSFLDMALLVGEENIQFTNPAFEEGDFGDLLIEFIAEYVKGARSRGGMPIWQFRNEAVEKFAILSGVYGESQYQNKFDDRLVTLLAEAEDVAGIVSMDYASFDPEDTGHDIYKKIIKIAGDPKAASLALNDVGIKGITYVGGRDGRCYVVFDEASIKIMEMMQIAWHGSPYRFSKFLLEKIGTGEGAQAHGWGLYFSLHEETAQGYRDRLSVDEDQVEEMRNELFVNMKLPLPFNIQPSNPEVEWDELFRTLQDMLNGDYAEQLSGDWVEFGDVIIYDGESFDADEFDTEAIEVNDFLKKYIEPQKDLLSEIAEVGRQIEDFYGAHEILYFADRGDHSDAFKEWFDRELRSGLEEIVAFEEGNMGTVYKVDIPGDSVMLDEQKELKDQPEFVQEALKKVWEDLAQIEPEINLDYLIDLAGDAMEAIDEAVYDMEQVYAGRMPNVVGSLRGAIEMMMAMALRKAAHEGLDLHKGSVQLSIARKVVDDIGFDVDALTKRAIAANILPAVEAACSFIDTGSGHKHVVRPLSDNMHGFEIYRTLVDEVHSPKAASLKLLEHGIKGIRYDGRQDGQCAVVFDEDAVNILEMMQAEQDKFKAEVEKANMQTTGTYSITNNTITLTPNANLSTFAHEMGHWYLETLFSVYDLKGVSASVRADVEVMLKDFGLNSVEAWYALPMKDREVFHERFAFYVEQYLAEGKAPTKETRGFFSRFGKWIRSVYNHFTGGAKEELDALYRERFDIDLPPMSDEVRRVLDRMIAAESAIKTAEQAEGIMHLFEQKPADMSDDDWQQYMQERDDAEAEAADKVQARMARDEKWFANARSKKLKEIQEKGKEIRSNIRAKVVDEVDDMPEVKALAFIKANKMKFSEDDLRMAGISAAMIQALRKNGLTVANYTVKGNYSQVTVSAARQLVAFARKYTNDKKFLTDLLTACDREKLIDDVTTQRCLEKHGEMFDQKKINNAVAEAIHNEARSRMIATELSYLANDKEGRSRIYREAARRTAEEMVAGMPIGSVKVRKFIAAEARASRKAFEALAKGDRYAAVLAKRAQLVNHEAALIAIDIEKQMRSVTQLKSRIFRADKKLAKTHDIDIINIARYVLTNEGLGRGAPSTGTPMAAIKYVEKLEKYDPEKFAIFTNFIEKHAYKGDIDFAKFSTRYAMEVVEDVQMLYGMARASKEVLLDGKRIDRQEIVNELIEQFDGENRTKWNGGEDRVASAKQHLAFHWMNFKSKMMRVESWCRAMDGGVNGPFFNYIFLPISNAAAKFRNTNTKTQEALIKVVKPMMAKWFPVREIEAPEIGYTFATKAELIGAILHTGNMSNKHKMLLGGRGEGKSWGYLVELQDGSNFVDTSNWDAFFNRCMQEGIITKEDMDTVQAIWDLTEATKPIAQAAFKQMYGTYFEEVEATEVVTPWGNYRGGYVPAITDKLLVADKQAKDEAKRISEQDFVSQMPVHQPGFSKSRVPNYTKPLALDVGLICGHVQEVLKFAIIAPVAQEVGKIISDRNFVEVIEQHNPTWVTQMLVPWLKRSYEQTVTDGKSDIFSNKLNQLRGIAGMNIMAGHIVNALQQWTGLSIAAAKVNPRFLAKAHVRLMGNDFTIGEMMEMSPFMKARLEDRAIEFQSQIERIVRTSENVKQAKGLINKAAAIDEKFDPARDWINRHGYFLQTAMQAPIDAIAWCGAYMQAIDQGMEHDKAVAEADSVVRTTMSDFAPENVAGIETGGALYRCFLVFYNYFNMQANLLGESWEVAKKTKKYGRFALDSMFIVAIPSIISAILTQMIQGFDTGDDDEWDTYDMLRLLIAEPLKNVFAMAPFLGGAINSAGAGLANADVAWAQFVWGEDPYQSRLMNAPAFDAIGTGGSSLLQWLKAAEGDDFNARGAVRGTLDLLSIATRVPFGALKKPLGYAAGVANDEIQPDSILDIARGLISGKDTSK